MTWSVGTKISVGFGLAILIFLIVDAISYNSTERLIAASNLRKHTYEVLNNIEDVTFTLTEAQAGQRGFYLTGDTTYLAAHDTAATRLATTLDNLDRQVVDNPDQGKRISRLRPLIEERLKQSRARVDARRVGDLESAAKTMVDGKEQDVFDDIQTILDEMENTEVGLLNTRAAEADAVAQRTKLLIGVGTASAVLLAVIAAVLLTRNIAGPMLQLTAVAERITVGDLSVTITPDGRTDEIGVLARTFDRMARSLRNMANAAELIVAGDLRTSIKPQSTADVLGNAFARMTEDLQSQIKQLVEGANVLGAAASEIVASTSQLSASASESAAAVGETTTTVAEVRQTAQVASQKARAVSDSAQKSAQFSQNGRKSTENVVAGMGQIRQQMEAIAASMVRLSEQSQTIGQIIATVEDLAAQSNLLAVNAAIEAAKAGEHGKGFSVVAQEVKSLAEQSRQATNQVRTILSDIQRATTAAVMATEQGSKAVAAGERQTAEAGESIRALADSVSEASQAATQIAASSQQQLAGVDQVATAMESIKQASTQNVASARQLESAATNLNDLGRRLKQMVERYKV